MQNLLQDLRHAVRSLRQAPGVTAIAVLTLAIGMGGSTAMFTLVNSLLLQALPYHQPERLVVVWERTPEGRTNPTSPANFNGWREQARSFEALVAGTDGPVNLTGGEPEEVLGRSTTGDYLSALGARTLLGRSYTAAEETQPVAVISHRLWERRYGRDPQILGRRIAVQGADRTVVGVLAPDFRPPLGRPDVWLPVRLPPDWPGRYLHAIGRLRNGVEFEQAAAEMATIGRRLAEARPEFNTGWTVAPVPLHEQVTGDARPALLVLLGSVCLLLLIACANVANLLLGRAASRRKEMAVRLSLGATRRRLIRQTLTESVLLAGMAGTAGLLLAIWGTELLVAVLPPDLALPRLDEVQVDGRVLGVALATVLATGVLFGAAPALYSSSTSPAETLRDTPRGTTVARSPLRRALVVSEVALALVLLTGAGLLARTLHQLLEVETGLRTEDVLTMRLTLSGAQYETDAARRNFMGDLLARLDALPGARAAGAESFLPLTGQKIGHAFRRADRPAPPPGQELSTDIRVVAGAYFEAMGIPVLRGRVFDARDHERAPATIVVNDALARRYFPGEEVLGKRIVYPWLDGDVEGEIVGVVGDVRELGPTHEPAPAIYRSYSQMPAPRMALVLRSDGNPLDLASSAASVVRTINPNLPVAEVRTLEQVAADTVARPRLNVYLLSGFAGVALILAALGIYGVISYSVAQRRQELGLRMALGAGRADVIRLVLRQGLGLTFAGMALGLAGALASTRLVRALLWNVEPTDPASLGAACLALAAVAALASYLPAARAARVDPASVLRN